MKDRETFKALGQTWIKVTEKNPLPKEASLIRGLLVYHPARGVQTVGWNYLYAPSDNMDVIEIPSTNTP